MISELKFVIDRFNLTDKAREALITANDEAASMGDKLIGTEHILIALSLDKKSVAGTILHNNNLSADIIRTEALKYSAEVAKLDGTEDITNLCFADSAMRMIGACVEISKDILPLSNGRIGTEHLLVSLCRTMDSVAVRIMISLNVNPNKLNKDIVSVVRAGLFLSQPLTKSDVMNIRIADPKGGNHGDIEEGPEELSDAMHDQGETALEHFGKDITLAAESGCYDDLVNREDEIQKLVLVLSRKKKNNPCLVGEPGVGKTAIIHSLARRIAKNDVPDALKDKRIIQIDLSNVVAGAKYRGEFEERLHAIIEEATFDDSVILFFDEIHTIVGSGSSEGSLDGANILKPALSDGNLRIIGCTTTSEYRKFFEKDKALSRRFVEVRVEEPNYDECLSILRGVSESYAKFHNVTIDEDILKACISLSKRYIPDKCLPDKAIDVLDEAATYVKLNTESFIDHVDASVNLNKAREELANLKHLRIDAIKKGDVDATIQLDKKVKELDTLICGSEFLSTAIKMQTLPVTLSDVMMVISKMTGVPVSKLSEDESAKLMALETSLHRRVKGQDEAIVKISKSIRRARLGLKDPKRPIGSFIFLGPTGVGKTELARSLAEIMFGDEKNLIRIDMSEFMEPHSVSKLVGSPPGYVGFDEGGGLTEQVRSHPYSIVLFDEIEKAHPSVFNILLQVLEDGILTDGKGRTVDFKNTIIIMTSNIGARDITQPKKVGFVAPSDAGLYDFIKTSIDEEMKKMFKPEFLNRVDETIVFKPLSADEIKEIARLQLDTLIARFKENYPIGISYSGDVIEYLASKGFDNLMGARPLKRLIQNEIEDLLADYVLSGKSEPICLNVCDGKVRING